MILPQISAVNKKSGCDEKNFIAVFGEVTKPLIYVFFRWGGFFCLTQTYQSKPNVDSVTQLYKNQPHLSRLRSTRNLIMSRATCFRIIAIPRVRANASRSTAQSPAIPRPEHPRPDFIRADWQTLNGRWDFEFDDADRGLAGTLVLRGQNALANPYKYHTASEQTERHRRYCVPRCDLVSALNRDPGKLARPARAPSLWRNRL